MQRIKDQIEENDQNWILYIYTYPPATGNEMFNQSMKCSSIHFGLNDKFDGKPSLHDEQAPQIDALRIKDGHCGRFA